VSNVTQETRRQLESQGTALAGVWGGPRKQRYYTPSGDEVWAIPSIREWVQRDAAGRVVDQGERDANLDKGWAFAPPAVLRLHCKGCDLWHDTQMEIEACVEARAEAATQWEKRARQQHKAEDVSAMEALTAQVEGLTALVEKLLEARG
tara:strand:+ start:635 stop:1081 length:447 start_codon:yes stop_codon:yes gene_type:complete